MTSKIILDDIISILPTAPASARVTLAQAGELELSRDPDDRRDLDWLLRTFRRRELVGLRIDEDTGSILAAFSPRVEPIMAVEDGEEGVAQVQTWSPVDYTLSRARQGAAAQLKLLRDAIGGALPLQLLVEPGKFEILDVRPLEPHLHDRYRLKVKKI